MMGKECLQYYSVFLYYTLSLNYNSKYCLYSLSKSNVNYMSEGAMNLEQKMHITISTEKPYIKGVEIELFKATVRNIWCTFG